MKLASLRNDGITVFGFLGVITTLGGIALHIKLGWGWLLITFGICLLWLDIRLKIDNVLIS